MTNRTHTGFLVLLIMTSLAGCNGASSTLPTAPSTARPMPPPVAACSLAGITLSGVVSEVTSTGTAPIAGARVFVSDDQDKSTDSEGFFSFTPVPVCVPGQIVIWVGKDGYDDEVGQPVVPGYGAGWRVVTIDGDTRLEITLVRR